MPEAKGIAPTNGEAEGPSEGPELDLLSLRVLAEKATPGPWFVVDEYGEADLSSGRDPFWADITQGPEGGRALKTSDAEFIAACHPGAILELLDELEELRAWRNGRKESCEAGSFLADEVER